MQWSCPHCGVTLAVGDDVLGTGWSFSRCYKCAGFALVRRAEINVIKVDKAPPGERVILPEGSSDPTANLMSAEATKKATKYLPQRKGAAASPPLPSPSLTPPALSPPSQHGNQKGSQHGGTPHSSPTPQNTQTIDIQPASFPEALPEISQRSSKSGGFPIGISTAAALMILSGGYLLIQSQNLWTRAQESMSASIGSTATASSASLASQGSQGSPGSQTSQDSQALQASRPRSNASSAGATASSRSANSRINSRANPKSSYTGSSASLSERGNPAYAVQESANTDITDQVQKSAMAPEKPFQVTDQMTSPATQMGSNQIGSADEIPQSTQGKSNSAQSSSIQSSSPQRAVAQGAPAQNVRDQSVPAQGALEQEGVRNSATPKIAAAALRQELQADPINQADQDKPGGQPFAVRVRAKRANLHSGPGMQFPVIGLAIPQERYFVSSWENRWFKLVLRENPTAGTTAGWIRNDLVQVIPDPSHSTATP